MISSELPEVLQNGDRILVMREGRLTAEFGHEDASEEKIMAAATGQLQEQALKREVLPEHVAAAVFVLTAGELPVTTGLHIPVDAGVAAAFLR